MGAPFEKALHLKNVGQAPAVFTFEGKHVPPGVVISPQRGSVGPGGTQEVMVEYTAPKSQLVEATLVAEVRCANPYPNPNPNPNLNPNLNPNPDPNPNPNPNPNLLAP